MPFGVKITERVDAPLAHGRFGDSKMARAAITALELLAGLYFDLFLDHIRRSIGVVRFAGPLNGQNPMGARFWQNYFRSNPTVVGSWNGHLQAALSDQ
jgi:hypothetical protein